ncbi:hypothetical protein GXM_08675 [Nostoc sphaeroides CCNUC1]|uniref:Uncharacterized protein n=1 Tax=Nostoc sphaeroides CCNUC1 TaxID=2653204 RepID=A0A5P8WF36_9NOSO|nr:hypothetical protein GXM_08675 [Nostoc sphaeroides CCNUC1]
MIFVVNLKQAICIPRRLTIKAVAVIHDPKKEVSLCQKSGKSPSS